MTKLNAQAQRRGAPEYRYVHCVALRPSEDIGRMASVHVRKRRFKGNPFMTKRILSLLDLGVGTEADLSSYLMFDGEFCRQLIELGRADAQARKHELLAFFDEASPTTATTSS